MISYLTSIDTVCLVPFLRYSTLKFGFGDLNVNVNLDWNKVFLTFLPPFLPSNKAGCAFTVNCSEITKRFWFVLLWFTDLQI